MESHHLKNTEVIIRVDKLIKQFGTFTAVDSISFEIFKGEIFGLLGPNGAGKTTTIRMLCGLLSPTSGQIYLNGQKINSKMRLLQKSGFARRKTSTGKS